MIISFPVFRRLPYRLQARVKFDVRVKLADRDFKIPTSILEAGKANLWWRRTWKTELIARLLGGENGLFIDVGANVGQTLLDLKIVKPHCSYIGFEPNAACVNHLEELIRLNSLDACRIFPVGLSDRPRCLPFFRHQGAAVDSSASIVPDLRPGRAYDVGIVPCFRFDEIVQDLKLGKVDLIKIDVEGAELEALKGMEASIRESQPPIVCEVLFTDSKGNLAAQDQRNAEIMQLLAGMRYKVLQLVKSADITRIIDLKPIQSFPSGYWSRENKELCDYLFFPESKEEEILRKFPLVR